MKLLLYGIIVSIMNLSAQFVIYIYIIHTNMCVYNSKKKSKIQKKLWRTGRGGGGGWLIKKKKKKPGI